MDEKLAIAGRIVTLSPTSQFLGCDENPKSSLEKGIIIELILYPYNVVRVKWDSGIINSYEEHDLIFREPEGRHGAVLNFKIE
jgi:hypothetical protein